jgi:hypothetical protein
MLPDTEAVTGIIPFPGGPIAPRVLRMAVRDCRICFGPHDQEIHDASVSIRRWFRGEVTKYLAGPDGPYLRSA